MVNGAPSSTVWRSIVLILPFLLLSSGAFGRPRCLTTGVGVGDVACLFLLLINVKPSASIRCVGGVVLRIGLAFIRTFQKYYKLIILKGRL